MIPSLINSKIYDLLYQILLYILNTNKIMINGVTRSSAFQITQSQINHTRKLDQITKSKRSLINFGIDVEKQMLISNQRHARAQSLKKIKTEEYIKNENKKMVMSMSKIALRSTQYPSQLKKHENKKSTFLQEQEKVKKAILQQNAYLIQKILLTKSSYSKSKSREEFKQSRQRLRRLEKFETFQKLTKSIKYIQHIVSQPSDKIKKSNSTLRIKTHESQNPEGQNLK